VTDIGTQKPPIHIPRPLPWKIPVTVPTREPVEVAV